MNGDGLAPELLGQLCEIVRAFGCDHNFGGQQIVDLVGSQASWMSWCQVGDIPSSAAKVLSSPRGTSAGSEGGGEIGSVERASQVLHHPHQMEQGLRVTQEACTMQLLNQMQHLPGAHQVGPSDADEFGIRVPPVLTAHRIDRAALCAARLGTSSGLRSCSGEESGGADERCCDCWIHEGDHDVHS